MKFTDLTGRDWGVPELSLWDIKTLHEATNIEIEEVIRSGCLWQDADDAWITIGVMAWHWCKGQHECTEEEFFRSWDGEVFAQAQEALLEAIANFTPKKRREALKRMGATVKNAIAMLPELSKNQVERIETILSENVTSGLEKLESQTLTDTASDSLPGSPSDNGTKPQASLQES